MFYCLKYHRLGFQLQLGISFLSLSLSLSLSDLSIPPCTGRFNDLHDKSILITWTYSPGSRKHISRAATYGMQGRKYLQGSSWFWMAIKERGGYKGTDHRLRESVMSSIRPRIRSDASCIIVMGNNSI